MGKIKKILENELVGGTQSTDVYPVTSVKAVYDEKSEGLNHILDRNTIVNISTNYNSEHIAEVLTKEDCIAKVPEENRVLGFQGKYLSSNGWYSISFIGDKISDWNDIEKWTTFPLDIEAESNKMSEAIDSKASIVDVQFAIKDLEKKIGDRIVIEGNVTNNPDEEDISTRNIEGKEVLSFNNRDYNPLSFSGKGYKILRKNLHPVDGTWKNILTQDMINEPNTVYEIRYDFDLDGEEIIIRDGCVLNFSGGSLKGGSIQFNETLLTGNEILIECSCTGIVKNPTLTPNMFGAKQDGFTDDVPFIQQAIELLNNRKGGTCLFKKGTYLIGSINVKLPNCSKKGAIHIRPNISYIGENDAIIKVKDNSDGFEGIFVGNDNYDSTNINFDNLIFDFNGVNNLYKQEWVTNKTTFFMAGIRVCYATNVKITNSIFKENSGLNCIILGYTEHGYVGNCSFINVAESVKGNTYIFDHSAIISAGSDFKAENNRLINDTYSATEAVGRPRVSTAIECNAYGQIITNNYIENFNIGILPSPVGITSLENAVINNNIIKNCHRALSVWCSEGETVNTTNLLFSGNLIESTLNSTFAIDLISYASNRMSNIQIVNNIIFSKTKDKQYGYIGIYAGNGIHELIIKGNSFINLSSSAIVVTSGKNIQIDSNCMINCGNNLLNSENSSLISLLTTSSLDKQDTPIIDNITITNNLLGGTTGTASEVIGFSIYGDVRYITFRNNIIDKCYSDFSLDNMTSTEIEGNYFNMDHKTNGWSEYVPNIRVSPGSILTDLKRNKIYYKTTKLSDRGWEKAQFILGDNYGSSNPEASLDKAGRVFFNTTTQSPVFCNGVDWLDADGIKTGIPRKGDSNTLPNMEYIYIQGGKDGFQYYNTEFKKSLRWVGDKWYEYDAEAAYIKRSGPFSSKPVPSNIGFQYFNTDTHKMITWDGSKWWNPDGTEATS